MMTPPTHNGTCCWLQVLMSDSPEAQQLEGASGTMPSSAQQSSEISSTSASSAADAAPSGPTPQSGSHALRIASNPNLRGPPPMFVKQPLQQLTDEAPESNNTHGLSSQGGARAAGNMQQPQAADRHQAGRRPAGRGNARQARGASKQHTNRPPRLQHDDPFLAYDITVA